MPIKLGSKVRDRHTGFSGLATGRAEYLYSSPRIEVETSDRDIDGKLLEERWIPEERLDVIE